MAEPAERPPGEAAVLDMTRPRARAAESAARGPLDRAIASTRAKLGGAESLCVDDGRPECRFRLRQRVLAAWLCVFACFAAVVALTASGSDAVWGAWGVGGYGLAAITAWRSPRPVPPLLIALAGAVVLPMTWPVAPGSATPDMSVVIRSAQLLLAAGSPYLPAGQLVTWLSYNPYLPAMAAFGLPRAVGLPGLLGDPRLWLALVSVVSLGAAFAVAAPHSIRRCGTCSRDVLLCGAFAAASPLLAMPLTLGITDPPVMGLVCLALACATRTPAAGITPGRAARYLPSWVALAALAAGAACAMKATAWPALPVIAVMLATRDGARAALRFAAAAAATMAALVLVMAPALLTMPGTLVANVVEFPLGLTRKQTPAASPLPGHLLASLGPGGKLAAITLLAAAGVAVAAWLVLRPPADGRAATWRLSLGLGLMFALAPATRFGYFAYPAGLLVWLALTRPPRHGPVLAAHDGQRLTGHDGQGQNGQGQNGQGGARPVCPQPTQSSASVSARP